MPDDYQDYDAYFTPLRKVKGTQSFAGGGAVQPHSRLESLASKINEEGFLPLRKARSEAVSMLNKRFSFNSMAAKENYATAWEKRDPWRKLKKNVSFAVPQDVSPPKFKRCNQSIVIIDPFSSGALLAKRAIAEGYHCIRILSEIDSPVASLVQEGMTLEFDATFQFDNRGVDTDTAVDTLISSLRRLPWEVLAVLPGAEPGVELADMLSNRMHLLTNGEELSMARRNKFLMGEQVRCCGIRAVLQMMTRDWSDIEAFFHEYIPDPFQIVVKPLESAGSDDVYLCHSQIEVRDAFNTINGKINGLGGVNEGALIQEYLDGIEYVVDSVSRDGVHKIVAIWEYDKRTINGANFVYFGMKLNSALGDRESELCDYAISVLDAMGVRFGPGHMEIKYTHSGPCLVEIGTRCHGGEGTWQEIANQCIGYNQIDATFDAYVAPERWEMLPDRPNHLKKAGRELFFVAREQGMLRCVPGLKEIEEMPSFLRCEIAVKPRDFVYRTVDCFTRPGSAQLVHTDENTVFENYNRIRDLERRGLFDFEIICPNPLPTPAIVIIDPFSSGALLGALVLQLKYRLVMVFSEINSPIANLIQQGTYLKPDITIQHDSAAADAEFAIGQTIEALLNLPHPVIAILPGAETGVELADILAVRIGTRSNTEELTLARRNKFLMGEQVKSCGVRAVQQALARNAADIEILFSDWKPEPFQIIVKPIESAGSDNIHLCNSLDEVFCAFHRISGKINGLGSINEGALIQEYLDGTEYVVDSVSRDGIHKVVAIWEYDKRSVNDTNFVYFGMEFKAVDTPESESLVAYARSVLDAMEIMNGPSHMEIKMTSTGPCLVEVGSRCHGGEGTWLPIANSCVGYNQIDLTLSAYVNPDQFEAIPMEPRALKNYGKEVFLVSFDTGIVKKVPGVDIIRQLSSFKGMEMSAQPGSYIQPTTDCFTRPGSVQLVNHSSESLAADYEQIRSLEKSGLFELDIDMNLKNESIPISEYFHSESPSYSKYALTSGGPPVLIL